MIEEKKERVAVIGLGNTLRRDDGIGIHVLALLEKRFKDSAEISFLNFGIASFGLINYIDQFKKVLLIDAIEAGLKPATLKIFRLEDASFHVSLKKFSSHELSLSDLLRLSQTLKLSTDIHIAGIQVQDTSYGLEMSRPLERAKSQVVEEISQFVKAAILPPRIS